MDLYTTQCYKKECPENYFDIVYDDQTYCVEDCADDEFFSIDYFDCIGCNYAFKGCTSCSVDEKDFVFCDECEEDLFVANNGIGCTPCKEDEFFYNDVCMRCDTQFPFCESCIQYPLLDWAPQQCLKCYGDTIKTFTPEGNTCGCNQDEFVHYDPKDLDTAECVACSAVLNHCLECDTDETNKPFCKHCDFGFFIDIKTGLCVRDSCNQVNPSGYCTLCNEVHDHVLKIQYN